MEVARISSKQKHFRKNAKNLFLFHEIVFAKFREKKPAKSIAATINYAKNLLSALTAQH